jgi:hypothetical protein
MSTPKWKKDLRMKQQAEEKQKREFEKKYGSVMTKRAKREFVPLVLAETYRRETVEIPSLETIPCGVCPPPERKVYTGTLIKGIATMHKSNAIPVLNKEQAVEISQMRR